jgi:hypothetical protein
MISQWDADLDVCGILYFKVNGIDVIKKQVTKPCLKSTSYEYSKQVGKNGITIGTHRNDNCQH